MGTRSLEVGDLEYADATWPLSSLFLGSVLSRPLLIPCRRHDWRVQLPSAHSSALVGSAPGQAMMCRCELLVVRSRRAVWSNPYGRWTVGARSDPTLTQERGTECVGCLEEPATLPGSHTSLTVAGWVFCPGSAIGRLDVSLDGLEPVKVAYGLPRPDVGATHADTAAGVSGFYGHIPFEAAARRGGVRVEVIATLDDGRRVKCLERTVFGSAGRFRRLHEVGSLLLGAAAKAWAALRQRRLPLSPAWWARALALHWRESTSGPAPVAKACAMDRDAFEASYRQWLRTVHVEQCRSAGATSSAEAPLIEIVALIDDTSDVGALIRTVRSQTYTMWELWLVLIAEPVAGLRQVEGDSRIRVLRLDEVSRGDRTWLPPGERPYVVLLDPNTILAPDALAGAAAAVSSYDGTEWIYTDDDWIDESGSRRDPYLKGVFSPALAIVDDYAARLAIVERSAIQRVGGLRGEYGEAQVYDLLWRVLHAGGRIQHLAEVCCHRTRRSPPVLGDRHRLAAERAFSAGSIPAQIRVEPSAPPAAFPLQRVQWERASVRDPLVTIVIPTREREDLLKACVASLRRTVNPETVTLLIVDDHSQSADALACLEALEGDGSLTCRVIRPPRSAGTFNYARLMNLASVHVETPLVLHLNNDVEAVSDGWVDQMAGWFVFDDIGIVGARLLYPDGSIQHAGAIVSPAQGVLEHLHGRLLAGDPGYQWLPHRVRDVSAVTGACLMTRTDLFTNLGGFDEWNLPVQFNDIDFCLRMREAGRRVVYEPAAVLYHRTSATRGRIYDYNENLFFFDKYRGYRDPFVSVHLDHRSLCGPTPELTTR